MELVSPPRRQRKSGVASAFTHGVAGSGQYGGRARPRSIDANAGRATPCGLPLPSERKQPLQRCAATLRQFVADGGDFIDSASRGHAGDDFSDNVATS